MRRVLALVLPATLLSLGFAASPSADAGVETAPITGRLIEYRTDSAVPNATVQLREVNADDTVGAVVAIATTSATGAFSLTPPSPADADYWVEVLANHRIQQPYLLDSPTSPSTLQWDLEFADQITPGTDVGRVNAVSSYLRGKVVNAANGNPLRGISVSLRDAVDRATVVGSAVTNSDGFYRIGGLEGEDFGLRINGTARGFERGWVACNLTVVPTWGAACGVGPGPLGKVKLDRL